MAKVSDQDIKDAFDYRKEKGKLELTAKELADILTEHFLPEGKSITRQAVDARLNKDGGISGIVETTHGRQKQYFKSEDNELLFADGGAWLSAYIRFLTPVEALSQFSIYAVVGVLIGAIYAILIFHQYVIETAVFGGLVAIAIYATGITLLMAGGFVNGVIRP